MKCLLIGTYFALCTHVPLDESCVRAKLTPHLRSLALMPALVESVVDECKVNFRGCCSWHKGIDGCLDNGDLMCKDGTVSDACDCRATETP